MNVIDAVQPSKALAITAVAKALGTGQQHSVRPGRRRVRRYPSVKDGPPPMGGDEPGFLAIGDLPPAGAKIAPWVATPVEPPKEEFNGSQCENVNWATVAAEVEELKGLPDPGEWEELLRPERDRADHQGRQGCRQAGRTRSSPTLSGCKNRKLTATVSKPKKVTSIGAQNTKVAGWTAVVSQKSTRGTAKYRVGIVSAGPKVIYTFLNPRDDYDFTDDQWDTVAVRAGERATQVD